MELGQYYIASDRLNKNTKKRVDDIGNNTTDDNKKRNNLIV